MKEHDMSKDKVEQPDFLADVLDIQEQIDELKKRLELVEQNRSKVRQKIYEKVKADYELKLENFFESLQPFREKIQSQIDSFEADIETHQNTLNEKQEELEEHQLRFFAGEYSEEEYEPVQSSLQEDIDTSRGEITDLENMVTEFRRHLAFISGELCEDGQPDEQESDDSDLEEEAAESSESDVLAEEDKGEPEELEESEDVLEEPETEEPAYFEDTFMKDTSSESATADSEAPEQPLSPDGLKEEEYSWNGIPVLNVVDGDFSGESYTIDKERITMGRGPNNDIQLATDTSVSRHHAQIVLENDQYILVDLDSSNGTSVNGMRVSRVTLRPNDEIAIGVSKMIIKDQD
jgi:flagellar biosynthesis chaperone FliJ